MKENNPTTSTQNMIMPVNMAAKPSTTSSGGTDTGNTSRTYHMARITAHIIKKPVTWITVWDCFNAISRITIIEAVANRMNGNKARIWSVVMVLRVEIMRYWGIRIS